MRDDIDETDIRLISELLDDGRISAKNLAKKADIHPNTLLFRIRRLEKQGIIENYTAKINFSKMGYNLHFIIFLKFPEGGPWDKDAMRGLLEIPELEAFYSITGDWDAMTCWRVRSREHFREILRQVASHRMVIRTSSRLVLDTHKTPFDFNPLNLNSESTKL
jgi:Lrp/AsnC family transcriptional regulator, leucine-responsive regulatory protein